MVNDFQKEIATVLKQHPQLEYDKVSNKLIGHLVVLEKDEYEIEIDLTPFPVSFPTVKETGERIHPIADRHIYSSGNCCFTTKAREDILLKKEIGSLPSFINKIVVPYFLNNSYYEITGKYRHGEYSHGTSGIIEGYKDILNIKNEMLVIAMLFDRLKQHKIRPNDKCYCGSQKKLKNCHIINYTDFKLIKKTTIQQDFINFYAEITFAFTVFQQLFLNSLAHQKAILEKTQHNNQIKIR